MRVLVTGSSGLIGRECCTALPIRGHEVVGLSRGGARSEPEQTVVAAELGTPEALDVMRGADRCDAVVHCAAALDRDDAATSLTLTNCVGTQQMLTLATEWKVERFLFMSSVQVVGHPRWIPVDETHPTAPATAYHATKLFGEQLTRLANASGLSAAILRIAAPLGPRMPAERIVPAFVRAALHGEPITVVGEGSRVQSYVDVRDVARAVELALTTSHAHGVFNVAGRESISNLHLAELCKAQLNSESKIALAGSDPEEDARWDISIERACVELGYDPACTLADSIDAIAGGIKP